MRFITATQFFSGLEFLPINTVLVIDENGLIKDILSAENIESANIEHFEGIITPGFINTHCHLELSHLKGIIKQHTGIVDFGLAVMKHRNDFSMELQQEAMRLADTEMELQGIVAVGDISNTIDSIKTKQQSNLYYHTFVELLALNPERANLVFDAGKTLVTSFEQSNLSVSMAAHAPYSASLNLISQISNFCYDKQKPTSIHNQESKTENDFFESRKGNYLRLYDTINFPIDYFKATGKSSLQSVINSFNTKVNTLLVHNTFTNKKDVELAQKKLSNLFWCLCAQANLYIENTLPNINLLVTSNCTLTLGTDSLASNSTLSIINEMNVILKHQPNILLQTLLKAATFNGAQFLGIQNEFGLITKNKKCGINLIEGKSGSFSVKKLA